MYIMCTCNTKIIQQKNFIVIISVKFENLHWRAARARAYNLFMQHAAVLCSEANSSRL